ncbi:probable serine/threonine-protein kinase PBL26 [Durio zibethinus]|uniref:Probable serine/threonine-protein kinase PBL26 n=1 Tax=Durio zibethinus TaxID=66656 RepID=A0A6P6ADW3_DURZI|nr:probable serine/threonine-protein kinase PBL26 [Durio zibethinus]
MPANQKKNVLVGIRIDSQSRDLLSWALVKVAEPGDCVVAVHVSRCSDHALGEKLMLEGYLEVYEGLCSVKKVDLKGQIFKGSSTRKVLIREARNYAAVALVVGIGKHSALGGWTSTARYCAKRLPTTTNVLAINNGKIVFRSNNYQLPGLKDDPRSSLCLIENPAARDCQSEYGDSEVGSEISSFEGIQNSKNGSRTSSEDSKNDILSVIREGKKISSRSLSLFAGDSMDYKPGWPLLLRASSATPQAKHARSMSVVKWVMNLPSRSPHHTPRCSTIKEIELNGSEDENDRSNSSMQYELQKCLEILLETNSSNCQWLSYKVLKAATAQFSTENLIGKGGSNLVYKGILPDGKAVAVKILKSSEEACKDFANEIEIISSLKHKHIMPLLGVCIKDYDLISVYDFSSKGSLEEILHGKNKEKHALSWEDRYNVAVGIAEGLNYLHNEHSRPVIHRDVKSSNILLSDGFEPKLSDFGLAVWGPTDSSFLTQPDVVGTFGYLAPEYFMYGKLSQKIDVYAFGVVLLELLSGKRPISFENHKGHQSLVMWAKPIIESGDVKGILDPSLNGNINKTQMHSMVLAATLCITRSARLRPKMSEILELLRGETAVEKWAETQNENTESLDHNDDEVYPNSSAELHLSLAMLDVDDDLTSFSSMEQSSRLSMEEYLKERWSRSSSFN